jgi:hypothetical protein
MEARRSETGWGVEPSFKLLGGAAMASLKSGDVIGIMLRSLTTNQNLALNPRTESEISPLSRGRLTQQAQEAPR